MHPLFLPKIKKVKSFSTQFFLYGENIREYPMRLLVMILLSNYFEVLLYVGDTMIVAVGDWGNQECASPLSRGTEERLLLV